VTKPVSGLWAKLIAEDGEPDEVSSIGAWGDARRERFVILLHGYNVKSAEAVPALRQFELGVQRHSAALAADIAWLLWPGYWSRPLLRVAAYPFKALDTPRMGKEIAKFLREKVAERKRSVDLVVVAHSLGCRVALETFRELIGDPGIRNATALLMAAAVPVVDVESRGRLRPAAEHAAKRAVLYSHQDSVLQIAFRIGQGVAPGEAGWGEAVGTGGEPRELWSDREEMYGYGHGSYWTAASTAAWFVQWMGHAAPRDLERRFNRRRFLASRGATIIRRLRSRDLY
jgi:hypothetical protein